MTEEKSANFKVRSGCQVIWEAENKEGREMNAIN